MRSLWCLLAALAACDPVLEPIPAADPASPSGLVPGPPPRTYPADLGADVRARFGASGDGVTDDTAALRMALADGRAADEDYAGKPKILYLPAGTYLVSDTLSWKGCCVTIRGQGARTVIRLKDGAAGFGDPARPRAVLRSPSGSTSRRASLFDLVIDTGSGNPGAIALDWVSSDVGAVEDVGLRSGDGAGAVGLSMTREFPGPCLVKNLNVTGFDVGIAVATPESGPTFESITLAGQNVVGLDNRGNTIAVRKLRSTNAVPAVRNGSSGGLVVLLDGTLSGGSPAVSAVVNHGVLYARNVVASGYRSLLQAKEVPLDGLSIGEHVSAAPLSLFPGPARSLGLPIEETPTFHSDDAGAWARFRPEAYGSSDGLQAALDSGRPIVYFPGGAYLIGGAAFRVPASVRRIAGFGSVVNAYDALGLTLVVDEPSPEPLVIDEFAYGVRVEHRAARPVVLRHGTYRYAHVAGAGRLFLEDVQIDELALAPGQSVWARQLNVQGSKLHVTNAGARLWVLGLEAEGTGTVVRTTGGGLTEVLGTLIYPAKSFSTPDAPAFINEESGHSLVYATSSYVANGLHPVQVRETRDGVTLELPAVKLAGRFMPLYVGYRE